MQEAVFDSRLLKDGHLYCPKEFAKPEAKFKVIVTLPDKEVEDASESDIEMVSAADNSDDFLSHEELEYYLSLDEK